MMSDFANVQGSSNTETIVNFAVFFFLPLCFPQQSSFDLSVCYGTNLS